MRMGSGDSFLSLERVGPDGPAIVWRISAAVAGAGCIAAVHGQAKVFAMDETPAQLAGFTDHRVQRFELTLSEGGWLRIKRVPSGRTLVRYRVGQWKAGMALEGEVRLEGEAAEAFCREIGSLL